MTNRITFRLDMTYYHSLICNFAFACILMILNSSGCHVLSLRDAMSDASVDGLVCRCKQRVQSAGRSSNCTAVNASHSKTVLKSCCNLPFSRVSWTLAFRRGCRRREEQGFPRLHTVYKRVSQFLQSRNTCSNPSR